MADAPPAPQVRAVSGAVLEELERDAARYRFLRTWARGTSLTMDGLQHWHLPGSALPRKARTFDEAVDTAMKQEGTP